MTENYRTTPCGEEMRCPECDGWAAADFVDNGAGLQRCSPYVCDQCGWVEDVNFIVESLSDFFKKESSK